jgi:thiol:disulfide interchange protein
MKPVTALRTLAFLVAFSSFGVGQWKNKPLDAPANPNPQLYPANANARHEISQAIAAGAKSHKRILLIFGGNWCIDCHILEKAFHQPRIEPLLNNNFVVAHVDVGEYTKNLDVAAKYHIDLKKGVPAIAVLNGNGGFLYSTSQFEKARVLSEDDVVQFLDRWKPTRSP